MLQNLFKCNFIAYYARFYIDLDIKVSSNRCRECSRDYYHGSMMPVTLQMPYRNLLCVGIFRFVCIFYFLSPLWQACGAIGKAESWKPSFSAGHRRSNLVFFINVVVVVVVVAWPAETRLHVHKSICVCNCAAKMPAGFCFCFVFVVLFRVNVLFRNLYGHLLNFGQISQLLADSFGWGNLNKMERN